MREILGRFQQVLVELYLTENNSAISTYANINKITNDKKFSFIKF